MREIDVSPEVPNVYCNVWLTEKNKRQTTMQKERFQKEQ